MKKYFAALSATALISVAPYALAASSTDLTVTGSITPASCTPTLSNGGVVDHGEISSKDLKPDNYTNLPRETLQLSVNCDSATPFKLKPFDHRRGSGVGGNLFGLGFINGDQKLGSFDARIQSPLADGVAVRTLWSRNNGDTWSPLADLDHGNLTAFGSLGGPLTPIPVKDLVADLQISTMIAPANSLDLTNEVALDGSVTIDIIY